MEYSRLNGEKCSKIMLGTAQFGLDYGIANKSGKVPYEKAREIVAFALESGINAFDTAPSYGDGEKVLGKIFADLGGKEEDIFISDKISSVPEGISPAEAQEFIRGSVLDSLKRLGFSRISLCLSHQEKDAYRMDAILKLREEGLIRMGGASLYRAQVAEDVFDSFDCDAFQVPASVLDLRFLRSGLFERFKQAEKAVVVRSIFFQGLFFLPDEEIPEDLVSVRPALKAIRNLAGEAGMSVSELAFRYAMTFPGAGAFLIGAEEVSQLKKNLEIFGRGPLPADLRERIESVVPEFDVDAYGVPSIKGETKKKRKNSDGGK